MAVASCLSKVLSLYYLLSSCFVCACVAVHHPAFILVHKQINFSVFCVCVSHVCLLEPKWLLRFSKTLQNKQFKQDNSRAVENKSYLFVMSRTGPDNNISEKLNGFVLFW